MSNEDPCLHFEAKLVPDLRTKIKKHLIAAICDLKQPGKVTKLYFEKFRCDVCARNQSGFITDNPIKWALALETYFRDDKSTTRKWLDKPDPKHDHKISSSKLLIYFDLMNKRSEVTININFSTGFLMVHGRAFKTWIQYEFSKVAKNAKGYSRGL